MQGGILLIHSPRSKASVHSGVVVAVLATIRQQGEKPMLDVYAIEGDIDEVGRLRGGRSLPVRRRLSPSKGNRFLRRTELRMESTRPLAH